MISSEVQRTLVKSPPELWAELSDPASLARHLGELGDIRIIRAEPESTVEWAAANTTGTVSIKPSGWGTKVTLSVTRELAAAPTPTPVAQAHAPAGPAEPTTTAHAAPTTTAQAEPTTTAQAAPGGAAPGGVAPALDASGGVEPADSTTAAQVAPGVAERQAAHEVESERIPPMATAEAAPAPASEPSATAAAGPDVEPAPRRGFLARLFGRRRTKDTPASEPTAEPAAAGKPAEQPAQAAATERPPEQPDAFAAVRQALAPETFAATHAFAALPDVKAAAAPAALESAAGRAPSEPAGDISAELMAAEELGNEEVTAVLTAVLDRLGAAHHRPFSRA